MEFGQGWLFLIRPHLGQDQLQQIWPNFEHVWLDEISAKFLLGKSSSNSVEFHTRSTWLNATQFQTRRTYLIRLNFGLINSAKFGQIRSSQCWSNFDRAYYDLIMSSQHWPKLGRIRPRRPQLNSVEFVLTKFWSSTRPNSVELAQTEFGRVGCSPIFGRTRSNSAEFDRVSPDQISAKFVPIKIWLNSFESVLVNCRPSRPWHFLSWTMRNFINCWISISFLFKGISNVIILFIWNTFLKFYK